MKFKLISGIVLVTVLAVSVWLLRRSRTEQTSPQSSSVEQPGSPQSTSQPFRKVARIQAKIRQPVEVDLQAASPAIQAIVNTQVDYRGRLAAMKQFSTNVVGVDWQALENFLLTRDPSDDQQGGQVLKNALFDALCELTPPPSGLGELLVQIYRDSNQNGVIRDYALQHLVAYYEQLEIAQVDDPYGRRMVRDVLLEALGELDSSMAGTALLGLARLSDGRNEFDRQGIGEAAREMAQSRGASELARISALQVCARLGVTKALPVLMQMAHEGQSVPLRVSAIAALGAMGNLETKPLLNTLASASDERIKISAQSALRQIARQEEQAKRD
jgi:hypothetical protein